MAERPPGFIPLEQQLDNRAGLSTQPSPGKWEQYIGEPTRRVAQMGLGGLQGLAKAGIQTRQLCAPRFCNYLYKSELR